MYGHNVKNTTDENVKYTPAVNALITHLTAQPWDFSSFTIDPPPLINVVQWREILVDLNASLKVEPRDALALKVRSLANCKLKLFEHAQTDLNASLDIEPQNALALVIRVEVRMFINQLGEALIDLNSLLELTPRDAFALKIRGDIKCKCGQFNTALTDLNSSLEIAPRDVFALTIRANIKKKMGQFNEALTDLNAALEIAPCNVYALKVRGDVKQKLRQFKEALPDLNSALEITPHDAYALKIRARVKFMLGQFKGALTDIDEALKIRPLDAIALTIRGDAKAVLGQFNDALTDLNTALEISPRTTFALNVRGRVKYKLELFSESLTDLNAFLQIAPHNEFALEYRGKVKYKLRDFCGALDDFNTLLNRNSNNRYLLSCRATIKQILNDQEGFERDFKAVLSEEALSKITLIRNHKILYLTDIELGKGTYGTVYHATVDGKEVAVKILNSDLSTMTRIITEIDFQAQLTTSHIVTLYGVSYTTSTIQLVMELMIKGSLRSLLLSERDLPWKIRLAISIGIVKGLLDLHQIGIIHCDIKSNNILLDAELNPKISDFGLARTQAAVEITENHQNPNSNIVKYWLAPELLMSTNTYTTATDVYALGMLLLEIAKNDVHHYELYQSNEEIKQAVCAGIRETIPPTTPPSFARLISQCWAQRAEQRPGMDTILSHLEKCVQQLTG